MFNFIRNYKTVLQSGCTVLHPHQQCMRLPITPTSLATLDIVGLLTFSHSNGYVAVSIVLIYHLYLLCGEMSIFPILLLLGSFFILGCKSSLYIVCTCLSSDTCFANRFSQYVACFVVLTVSFEKQRV